MVQPSGIPTATTTSRVGQYEIVEPLKTGGTAAIYLGLLRSENGFTREVVIKKPLPHLLADRQLRAMFEDEAHIASRLAHPNVVQVLDLVVRDDDVFLVLEYLRGRDLRELLRSATERGRLVPEDISAYVIAETAAGLDYAHDARAADGSPLGLVHRDVSPKNIRITDRGAVKVIDFGIARSEQRLTETQPGSVKGTVGYMSPEQVMGDVVDRRSDVFSLGICFYQLLTGRNPFDGATLRDRIQRLLHHPIPAPSEIRPGVDPRLEAAVMRCLAREPAERFERMSGLEEALEPYLAEQGGASMRRRLVAYLEDLFPDIHAAPARLEERIATESGLARRRARPDGPLSGDSAISAWAAPPDLGLANRPGDAPVETRSADERDAAWAEEAARVGLEPLAGPASSDGPRAPTATGPLAARTTGGAPTRVPVSDLALPALERTAAVSDPARAPAIDRGTEQTAPAIDGASERRTELAQPAARGAPSRSLLVGAAGGIAAAIAAIVVAWPRAELPEIEVLELPPELRAAAVSPSPSPSPSVVASPSPSVTHASPAPSLVASPLPSAAATPAPSVTPTSASPSVVSSPAPSVTAAPSPPPSATTPPRAPAASADARRYFEAARRAEAAGEDGDAEVLYVLAHAASGRRVEPAVLRNLAALSSRGPSAAPARARACVERYLAVRPDAPDRARLTAAAERWPPGGTCVGEDDVRRAETTERRAAARLGRWLTAPR